MTKYILPLCAALLLLPTAALAAPAQTNDEGATVESDGLDRFIQFGDDENVDGEVLSADGTQIHSKTAKDHANMIGIRGQFIPQLIALSQDI